MALPSINYSMNHSPAASIAAPSCSSTPIAQEDLPSVFDLARMSPSKTMAKPTALSLNRDQICAICNTDCPGAWIGCDGLKGANRCNYWVHAGCLGFINVSKERLDQCNLDYYCPEHNPVLKAMDAEREQKSLKGK